MAETTQHKEANAGPLGLLGFGMSTILLNLHNSGVIELSIVILAMGICMGGLAQIIAGIMEFKAGNTFGATAFTAYGLFWWTLVLILLTPFGQEADGKSMGFYLLLWCIFYCIYVYRHHESQSCDTDRIRKPGDPVFTSGAGSFYRICRDRPDCRDRRHFLRRFRDLYRSSRYCGWRVQPSDHAGISQQKKKLILQDCSLREQEYPGRLFFFVSEKGRGAPLPESGQTVTIHSFFI